MYSLTNRAGRSGARVNEELGLQRRRLLGLVSGSATAATAHLVGPRVLGAATASTYRVGLAHVSDPYEATRRAVAASGEWPAAQMMGKVVIIKPNLVSAQPASTGITTDPQVVRALVELSLTAGASRVLVVEGGQGTAQFTACGYDFLRTYDPGGRVALVDLNDQPMTFVKVPNGLAYAWLYMPKLVVDPEIVFISAAKLKCHKQAAATLSVKNLFGLPPFEKYISSTEARTRMPMHHRGLHQTVVDLNLVRPIDFAVVDGIWGMEGNGPTAGTAVRMDLVVAGQNAVAVDRVCLHVTQTPPARVQHLTYASAKGLGPRDLSSVQITGDTFTPRPFLQPTIPPLLWRPVALPSIFMPDSGQQARITCRIDTACVTKIEIVRTSETSPSVTHIRSLSPWTSRAAGFAEVTWDGKDDSGRRVPNGVYTMYIQGRQSVEAGALAHATGWVTVA